MLTRLILALVLVGASTTTVLADAHSDIANAMNTFSHLKSYHSEMMMAGQPTSSDYLAPNRMRATTPQGVVIIIDRITYMQLNGKWKKFPPGEAMADTMAFLSKRNGGFTATDLGMRMVGGQSLHAYNVKTLKTGSNTTVLIDGSGRIVRMATGSLVMTFSKFNAPVTINAPM